MTLTGNSIFENGKLKPGTYKIQSLHTEGYVDVYESSREVCCHATQELQEGKGLVRRCPLPMARV